MYSPPAFVYAFLSYTTLPPPLGIHNTPIHRLIDIDKTGFYLKKFSSNYGRGHRTYRMRFLHYRRNDTKINVILVVESGNLNIPPQLDGIIERPRKWLRLSMDNVNQFLFGGFVHEILHNIETTPPLRWIWRWQIIIWDNLRAHKMSYVTNLIDERVIHHNFCLVYYPPYCLKITPIEYICCELAAELSWRCVREWTVIDLRRNINDIVRNLEQNRRVHSTWVHCGYLF